MRWPWQRKPPERRDSGGSFFGRVLAQIEGEAAGTAATAGSTAALEAVAGLLARSLAAARVQGPSWATGPVQAILGQVGRDLVRGGESLHVIRMSGGELRLALADQWHWEGGTWDPSTWTCRATCYGPSSSTTWLLPSREVVFLRWGSRAGQPYVGTAPMQWASTSARLNREVERSLGDEAAGPVAQMLPIPDGGNEDVLGFREDIAKARGRATFPPTTSDAWGEGRDSAPRRDWQAARLGPNMPQTMVELARDSFARTVAACGASVALFDDSDGTAKREALRQFHLGTVKPLAAMIAAELSAKLEAAIRLEFDLYNVDLQGRATAFQKLVAGGVAVERAASLSGLMVPEDGA